MATPQGDAASLGATTTVVSDATSPRTTSVRRVADITPEVVAKAEEILWADSNADFGTEVPFVVNGRRYVARFEWHDNPDGDPDRPLGRHKGVTVYDDDE
jgi:hypothetical protein